MIGTNYSANLVRIVTLYSDAIAFFLLIKKIMDMYICRNKYNQRKKSKLKRNSIKHKMFYGYKSNFTIIIEK